LNKSYLLMPVLALLAACGQTVQPGQAGVMVRNFGSSAGVDQQPLKTGWNSTGWGEDIKLYPTIQKTYSFSGDQGQISFTDRNGLPMAADVTITLRVVPTSAPKIYQKYRLDFDELLGGPAIALESELVTVDQMLGGGRQVVIQRAFQRVAGVWAKEGVEITQLSWLGQIHYPESVSSTIVARAHAARLIETETAVGWTALNWLITKATAR